ncbi:MAG: hypothetical protein J5I90_09715 [Caldilineales bacterium]|nr:hypothetical protein [Caldilineales bacterium]
MPDEPQRNDQPETDADEESIGGVGVIIPGNGEAVVRPAPTPASPPAKSVSSSKPSAAEIEAEAENGFLAADDAGVAPAEATVLATAPPPPAADEGPPPLETRPVASPDNSRSRSFLTILLAALLGALLSLLILLLINGTLDFSQHERFLLLQSDVATLRQDMDGVKQVSGKNLDSVATLDARLNEVGAEMQGQGEQIAALQGQLSDLSDALDQTSAAAAATDERLSNLDGNLADAGERMGVLESEVMSQSDQVDALGGNVDSIGTEVNDIQAVMVTVDSTLQQLVNNDISLQEAVAVITARIAELDSTAKRFDNFVGSLRQALEQASGGIGAGATASPNEQPPATIAPSPTVSAPVEATPSSEPPVTATPAPAVDEPFTGTPALQRFPADTPITYPEPEQSHIFGLVYDDRNHSRIPDQGDKALSGITVILRDPSDREIATVVTGPDGRYLFANVRPGLYFVVEMDADGSTSVTPNYVNVSARPDRLVEVNFADQSE